MYSLKKDFTYTKNKTLTGEKIIAGIKECNSYILIKKEYEKSFLSFLDKLNKGMEVEELSADEKVICNVFIDKGFLEGSKNTNSSFNEYNSFVKKIFEKKLNNISNKKYSRITKNIFAALYICLFIVGMLYIYKYYGKFMSIRLDIKDFKPVEIFICVLVFPVVIDFMHEFGHFLVARMLNIQVDKIVIGFFVTWPTIFLQYKGLNLYKTWEKVFVASAGIAIHLANLLIGIFIYSIGYEYLLLNVWIIANMGMAIGNLMLLGPTDGYFILTSLLGVYNFRYTGYKTLKYFFYKKGDKPNRYGIFCSCLLSILWGGSFVGIYLTCKYYSMVLGLSILYVNIFSFILITLLIVRFICKIRDV